MGVLKKIFILSIVILLGSFGTYRYLELHKNDYLMVKGAYGVMRIVMYLDSFLKYFNITGLYRGCERLVGTAIFSMVNASELDIERKEFDGIEVFLFDPIKHELNRPAIVYYHGGGWVFYDPRFYSHMVAELARRLNILIISVNYRKAPEHPFPAGVSDCLDATKYFLKNAENFNVDPNRIALMGDSAGGNLVVAVGYHLAALRKNHKHMRVPKILVPLCSSLQMADLKMPSMRGEHVEKDGIALIFCLYAFGELKNEELQSCINVVSTNSHLNEEAVEKIRDNVDWTQYLSGRGYDNRPKSSFKSIPNQFSEKFSKLVLDPLFSPLSALNNSQLAFLPPVYLLAASMELTKDDSKLFTARLSKIGRLGVYKEFNHFHDSFVLATLGYSKSKEAFDDLIEIFKGNAIL